MTEHKPKPKWAPIIIAICISAMICWIPLYFVLRHFGVL